MTLWRNLVVALVAAFVLAACSSSNSDDPPMKETPPVTEMPDPKPENTELMDAQSAASDAADAAKTAADNAAAAATDAADAIANLATMQTGATAADLAQEAQDAADKAMEAYMAAKEASEVAAAAETITAAVEAKSDAEEAQADAEMYETTAVEKGGDAEAAAVGELMISGTMKSVGGTTVDADAPHKVVTTVADGTTTVVDTGLQRSLMEEDTGAVDGVEFVAAVAPAADTAYVQDVAARDITIGKVVDSDDDTARLAIIHSYAGSKTVKVFADITGTTVVGTEAGKVSVGSDGTASTTETDINATSLRPAGTFYEAGDGTATALAATLEVADDAEGVRVYSYRTAGTDADDPADDVTTYVRLSSTNEVEGGDTTYTYQVVGITANASDATTEGTAEEVQVTAKIPDATAYEHIHFGVWASLNDDGTEASGLGLGFVQNYDGAPTEASDMPNHGDATYDGNWVATIQAADEDGDGAVTLEDGVATMTADFEKMTVEADLTGLATLSGDISGNTFSGDEVSDIDDNRLSSDADDFTGSMSGGFFGTRAAEAGGVFSFTSEDMEEGGFSGAFGGAR